MTTTRLFSTAAVAGPCGIRRFAACWVLVALLWPALGCATYRQTEREMRQAIQDWQRKQLDLAALGQADVTPTTGPSRAPSVPTPAAEQESERAPDSRLQQLVREALQRNPTIQAAIADVEAKLERIPQVTTLGDPVLRAIVRPEPIQTAAGDAYLTLGVAQTIPWPVKLDRAGKRAAAEVRAAIELLNAARLRVIADVERCYHRLYLADRSIELTAANRRLLEDLEQVVTARYQVGKVQQQDVLRLQTELAKLRDDESRYRRQRTSSAAALNQLLDRPVTTDVPVTEVAQQHEMTVEVEQLIQLAETHNPELARLRHELERDRQGVALADLAYWPDVMLGAEWTYVEPRDPFIPPINPQTGQRPPFSRKSEAGDDNWAVTLQLNLPVWFARIEAAKREARRNLLRTQHEKRAAFNLIAFRVYDAWVRVQMQQETVQLLASTLIPQARQTYEVSLAAYQAGSADFLTVIDNWRQKLNLELMYHRELADLETAFSELQREVGLQLVRDELADEAQADGNGS
jgi:cobalt-zinc-cadmium efflux system outer membrane protein